MRRWDTLCNTTPAVADFIAHLPLPSHGHSATDVFAREEETSRDDANAGSVCHRAPMLLAGDVFLTSLPCVARLARQRKLLCHDPQAPSVTEANELSRASPRVFIRLVLSLLGSSTVEMKTASERSQDGGDKLLETELSLPWSSDDGASTIGSGKDDACYDLPCITDHWGGVDTADANQCACPRLLLRSFPVCAISLETVTALTHEFQRVSSEEETSRVGGGATEVRQKDRTDAAEPRGAVAEAGAGTASWATQALEEFRNCVRQHEKACLVQFQQVLALLLQEAEPSPKTHGGTSESCSASSPPPLRHVIHVPIYGVPLRVEDTPATRLARVDQITTPLLQSVVGISDADPDGLLQPLTCVLQTMHEWGTLASAPPISNIASTHSELKKEHALHHFRFGHLYHVITKYLSDGSWCTEQSDVFDSISGSSARPGVVVHCQLGVSRSPSVVTLFFMHIFEQQLRAAVRFKEGNSSGLNSSSSLAVFQGLLGALVKARRQVKPNVCFAVQLLFLWNRVMHTERPGFQPAAFHDDDSDCERRHGL